MMTLMHYERVNYLLVSGGEGDILAANLIVQEELFNLQVQDVV